MTAATSAPPAEAVLGSIEPRLYTPPLRPLSPDTSYGYDVIAFAEAIGWPLDPWQQWLLIHLCELLPDGRPRFRQALVIVARQNGKSVLTRILILYWLFVARLSLVVATHTDRGNAKRSWAQTVAMAEAVPMLAGELPTVHTKLQLGEEDFWTIHNSHYRFAAPNRRAGRGDPIAAAVLDEIREHASRDTFDAVAGGMNAARHGQLIAISNQGDRRAVVLDSLREPALAYIATGRGDHRLGLFEWSAPKGSRPTDLHALAQANPDLNRRGVDADALLGMAMRAEAAGGDELDSFLTEYMCIAVELLDPGIRADAWAACGPTDEAPAVDLAPHRAQLAFLVDVAPDGHGVALAAAAVLDDDRVHAEIVAKWDTAAAMRKELPAIVERVRPRALGWFPSSPTAAVMVDLQNPRQRTATRWPPRRVNLTPITSETTAVCMGLAELVDAGELRHNGDPLATAHAEGAIRRPRPNDTWVFDRRGGGHVYALYALAGAVHLARTLPKPRTPLQSVPATPK
jgi:hypothetical protein